MKLIVRLTVFATLTLAPSLALAANEKASAEMIARGKQLVTQGLCHDCHTPKIFGPQGPVIDTSKLMSGSPAGMKLPPTDRRVLEPGYWIMGSPDLTAWMGPWGISYAANLTPDEQTGIGLWTDAVFVSALRNGKHLGEGRPILPPMPWQFIRTMSDDDLKAIFAYLKSLPPVKNAVPQPVAPPDVK